MTATTFTAEERERLRVRLNDLPLFGATGLYVRTSDGRVRLATEPFGFDSSSTVDLADDTTADRLARWLAGRVELPAGCTAPWWESGFPATDASATWRLISVRESREFGGLQDSMPGWLTVPTLAGLDATDDRRMPDGSRFIDRLALGLVALHLARTTW